MVLESIGPQIAGNYVTAQVFENLLGNLNRLGFFEFLLPFLLFLAIIFGVLRFSLKEQLDKSAAALISIVASFFVLNYSGSVGIQVAAFFTNFFGASMIFLAGILLILVFLGLVGVKPDKLFDTSGHKWAFVLLIVFIGILLFIGAGGGGLLQIPSSIGGFTGNDVATLVFFLIILGLAVWFLGNQGNGKDSGGDKKE